MKSLKETWKKIVKIHGGGCLLSLCSVFLLTIGFSSWLVLPQAINVGEVNVIVGNIKGGSPIQEDGVFYRFKSEYAFKYFYKTNGTTNEYICNDPRLGFQVIVNSDTLTNAINKDSPKPSSLYIETSISYTSVNDFDMFSNGSTNTNTVSPKKQIFSLMDRPEYIFESEATECSYTHGSDGYKGTISARTLLYEDGENSLLEFTKMFSLSDQNKDTIYNVYFPFEIKEGFSFEDYKGLTFDISVNLTVKRIL